MEKAITDNKIPITLIITFKNNNNHNRLKREPKKIRIIIIAKNWIEDVKDIEKVKDFIDSIINMKGYDCMSERLSDLQGIINKEIRLTIAGTPSTLYYLYLDVILEALPR